MDTQTFTVLEFDKIITFLKYYVTSPQGGRLCDRLTPSTRLSEIKTLLAEVSEMKEMLHINNAIPIHGIRDIASLLNKTRVEGFYLEPQQLQEIHSTLGTARTIKLFFNDCASQFPALHGITGRIIPLTELENAIGKAVGSHGEILDTASQELKVLRRKIRQVKLQVKNTLEGLLNNENLLFIFQEQLITIRNGRFVLPVKIEHTGYLPGVVHDQSHSKATNFIEPLSAVTLNNELQILRTEEMREEVRILLQLTRTVRESQAEVLFNLSLLEKLDLTYAKAQMSRALNGTEPLFSEEGHIKLISCKHPILLARYEAAPLSRDAAVQEKRLLFDTPQIVPVTIEMHKDISTLIVTGANAGGKTVTLKTLGILSLMAQAGMHIPAEEGSTLPVFHSIFADIGDQQNIEESLSTFSAHIRRLDQIIRESDSRSLILIDELGAGTDPSEGAALGLAILDCLREKKSSTIITTHLTLLKTYAYLHRDVENVSVAFDPVTLKPTYNLVYGMPGLSNALSIAENLGISKAILHNARSYLDEKDKNTLNLIKGLERSQRELAARHKELAQLREMTAVHENRAESLVNIIKARKEKILSVYEKTFNQYLREMETHLENLVREIKNRKEPSLKKAQKELQEVKAKWQGYLPAPAEKTKPIEELKEGQTVKLARFKQEGVVLRVDQNLHKAEIMVGDLKVKAGFDAIEKVAERKDHTAATPPPEQLSAGTDYLSTLEEESVLNRVNVIGMTVDEALPIVDRTIDHALIRGVDRIEIIHGLGTGRLKEAIRRHLRDHTCVRRFGSDEHSRGGAGVTQVEIQVHPEDPSRGTHRTG